MTEAAPTPQADQEDALREALAEAIGNAEMENGDDLDPGLLRHWIPDGIPATEQKNLLSAANACLVGPLATLRTERDQLATDLREAREERDEAIREIGEWAQVADYAQSRATAAEAAVRERDAEIERLKTKVDAALNDACRMQSILLMAGEMTAQERRTARAVALGLAWRVRAALTPDPQPATAEEAGNHG